VTIPRAALFDIGSTLWSSPAEDADALAYCYGRGAEALGWALPLETLIDAVEGYFAEWEDVWRLDSTQVLQRPTTAFVAEALARIGLTPAPDVLLAFTDAILETSVHTAKVEPPEPGMKEALAELKQRGLRLACVSNAFMGAAVLDAIMAERGLGPYLELTVSSCELGYRKPHPAIYQAALDKLGMAGEEVVFVGDRLDADVAGPAALGMRGVLTHQYRQEDPAVASVKPDAVIKHLSELVPYIDGLLKG
jgi:HAD superfamily hydrolase (TIGR01549 family)